MNKKTNESDFDIQSIAQLARIKVDDTQAVELQASINDVLGFIDQIRDANVPNVEPKDFFRLTKNRLRPDADPIESGTFTNKIMRVAPNKEGDYFLPVYSQKHFSYAF